MKEFNYENYPKMNSGFHNRITETFAVLNEEQHNKTIKSSRALKAVLIAAAIIIVGSIGTFATNKAYKNWIVQKNNGVNLALTSETSDSNKDAYKYVQIKLNYLTPGLSSDNEGRNFSFDASQFENIYPTRLSGDDDVKEFNPKVYGQGISLRLYKADGPEEFNIKNTVGFEECYFGSNKGAILHHSQYYKDFGFDRIVIIYFENEGYVFECYIGDDISDEEMMKIANGVELVATTEEKAFECESLKDSLSNVLNIAPIKYKTMYNKGETIQIIPESYSDEIVKSYDLTLKNVEVYDDISAFNKNCFRLNIKEDKKIDENYNIPSGKKFVCLTVEITNSTNKDGIIVNNFCVLSSSENSLEGINNSLNFAVLDSFDYTETDGYNHSFSYIKFKANETKTVKYGYIVDDNLIDNLYMTVNEYTPQKTISNNESGDTTANGERDYEKCLIKLN